MFKKYRLGSLKVRLVIVTICNIFISLAIGIVTISMLDIRTPGIWYVIPEGFEILLAVFLAVNLILNAVTTSIIFRPIQSLTTEVEKVIKEGNIHDLDISRYPELEKLISTVFKFVDSAER